MRKIFDKLPNSFFNLLASDSNKEVYSACLLVVYEQYEHQVDYRLPIERIKDAIVRYLSANGLLIQDESDAASTRSYTEAANRILYKMCDKDVMWLKRETDTYTLKDNIVMTQQGIELAQYLYSSIHEEEINYAGCIFDMYNTLQNDKQWSERPYDDGLKMVYAKAKQLSSALQKLSTNLETITRSAISEESLESVVENFFSFNDTFLPQYSQLKKSANIYRVQKEINGLLDQRTGTEQQLDHIVMNCLHSEGWETTDDYDRAVVRVIEMINSIKRFMSEDYDDIMRHITRQMNSYLEIMISQLRFKRNRNSDAQSIIERTLSELTGNEEFMNAPDDAIVSDEISRFFIIGSNRYIDTQSVYLPRTIRIVSDPVVAESARLSEEEEQRSMDAIKSAAENPYSRENMRTLTEMAMAGKDRFTSADIPIKSHNDALAELSMALYAQENGYDVAIGEDYIQRGNITLRTSVISPKAQNPSDS